MPEPRVALAHMYGYAHDHCADTSTSKKMGGRRLRVFRQQIIFASNVGIVGFINGVEKGYRMRPI